VEEEEEEEEEGEKRQDPQPRRPHNFEEKIYIYYIYTPNLGLAITVFDREKGAGPL